LSWWEEAGVDTIVGETPRDWLAPKVPAAKASAPVAEPEQTETLPDQLGAFQTWLAATDSLPFAAPGARRVAPAGEAGAGLMVVTDAPSAEDAAAGTLFSGETGALFDRMLAAIGQSRETIYLAPLSPVAPPAGKIGGGNLQRLTEILRHHIGLVKPGALLVFGNDTSRGLFGAVTAQMRGRWLELETPQGPVRAVVTIRPQELHGNRNLRAMAWEDLQMLMEGLKA
jgi:DNA polymerase